MRLAGRARRVVISGGHHDLDDATDARMEDISPRISQREHTPTGGMALAVRLRAQAQIPGLCAVPGTRSGFDARIYPAQQATNRVNPL